jgi:hypothetical protein
MIGVGGIAMVLTCVRFDKIPWLVDHWVLWSGLGSLYMVTVLLVDDIVVRITDAITAPGTMRSSAEIRLPSPLEVRVDLDRDTRSCLAAIADRAAK